MYTPTKFTNFDFFIRVFPNVSLTTNTKVKILKIYFMASESTAGFLITKNNILKKFRENDISVPAENLPTSHIMLTDKEARSVGLLVG